MTLPISYRAARDADLGFIISAWLRSAGQAWSELRELPAERFAGVRVAHLADVPHRFTRNAVCRILEDASTIVACDPEDDGAIYGFAVYRAPDVIHWVHVKHAMRRFGVARAMLAEAGVDPNRATCTYLSRAWPEWVGKLDVRFDPHA